MTEGVKNNNLGALILAGIFVFLGFACLFLGFMSITTGTPIIPNAARCEYSNATEEAGLLYSVDCIDWMCKNTPEQIADYMCGGN